MLKRLFCIFLLIIGMALVLANKSFAVILDKGTDKVSVRLITNFEAFNPKQDTEVLLRFQMQGDWHIFSETPSIAGYPTKVEWNLPQGFEVRDIRWSKDKKFVTEGIEQFGYSGTAYYAAKIVSLDSKEAKKLSVKAKVSWLACAEECVPETVMLEFEFPQKVTDLTVTPGFIEEMEKANKSFIGDLPKEKKSAQNNLFLIMLMAFGGGIILNFMPCVFPVLSLKVISLTQHIGNKNKSRVEALLYAGGVVVSFLVIAGVLVWLRATGEQIGWGFQLQSSIFVSIMLVIFFLIFLMLLDVVDFCSVWAGKIGNILFKNDKLNAFITGFFAVLIASPCTAPFMGIAVAYALTHPLYIYFPVFFMMGIGYALPFSLAGFYPEFLQKVLPRPGKWMSVLKKIFAIPVFFTCVWLGWVLYSQNNEKSVLESELLNWNAYDASVVEHTLEQKKPIFIVFTAKWCITCLVNEKAVLETQSFARLVKQKGISLFKADWTSKDETISKALEKYGRNSVPLYVYYDDSGDYKILPQLLTPALVEEYLLQ